MPDPPLIIRDLPAVQEEITQSEIVAFSTALSIFRVARADFEAKRATLTLKLLQFSLCEEGDYFASLDERGNLVIDDNTSLDPITRRMVTDRDSIPSGGAA